MRATLNTKDEQIKKLKDSFAELNKLKADNETQLLEKFSLLLNEKKLKIRDQQRLLACANVDPAKLREVEASRGKSHSPGPSRKGKRKAAQHDGSDSGSDGGFEGMEIDEPPADYSEQEQPQTPEQSTEDEADSDDERPAPPPIRKSGMKGKEAAKNMASTKVPETVVLPPKRELPFSRKPPATASKPAPPTDLEPAAPVEGSETESEDDEL